MFSELYNFENSQNLKIFTFLLLLVETDYGISCPFSDRVYQLSDDSIAQNPLAKARAQRTLTSEHETQFSLIYGRGGDNSNCEHYLKIGCDSNKDYSINKKCQYSFNNQHEEPEIKHLIKKDLYYDSMPQLVQKPAENRQPVLPVLESETSRICLAYWPLHRAKIKNSEAHMDVEEANELHSDLSGDIQVNSFIVVSKSTNSEQVTIKCSVSFFVVYERIKF